MPQTVAIVPGVPLSQLLAQLDEAKKLWGQNPPITGVTADSRDLKPGNLFVAIRGEHHDGHQFLPEVIRRGAVALVVETVPHGISPGACAVIQVKKSRRALAQLAAALYGQPARDLVCTGVTGTTGKTTTTFLLNALLEGAGLKTGLLGTICQKVGKDVFPSDMTTPEPLVLHQRFAAMRRQGVSHAVMEVSSHSLCQERVTGIPFTAAVFTNLSREHLNYHKTMSHYLASKAKLFSSLPPTSFAILNLDDPTSAFIEKRTRARVLTYGTSPQADLQARETRVGQQGISFRLVLTRPLETRAGKTLPPGHWEVVLPLLGRHNVSNALGAIGAALILDVEPETITRVLRDFPGVPRRLQVVYKGPFTIIDDFGHNEASLQAVFRAIGAMKYRKLVIVNYLKGSRGIEANEITAQQIATAARRLRLARVISTRSDSHVISKNIVQDEEEEAFTRIIREAGLPVTNTRELPDAIGLGLDSVDTGDILLLLGPSGMDAGADLALQFLRSRNLLPSRSPRPYWKHAQVQ